LEALHSHFQPIYHLKVFKNSGSVPPPALSLSLFLSLSLSLSLSEGLRISRKFKDKFNSRCSNPYFKSIKKQSLSMSDAFEAESIILLYYGRLATKGTQLMPLFL
jgi:hypothetical protein